MELARRARQPLLEADAVLAQYQWLAPFAAPAQALESLRLAERIFLAHAQQLSAVRCRIEQACAMADLGQEIAAIDAAQNALQFDGLHVDDRLHAHLTIAACHLHTGNIDASEQELVARALPLAASGGHAALRARVRWRQGMVLMARLIARHQPAMWLTFVGLPQQAKVTRTVAQAMQLMDEAQQMLPSGFPSGELRLARFGGLALLGADDQALGELHTLWQQSSPIDPALAVRTQFTLSLVAHRTGHPAHAIRSLAHALSMAQAWDQLALARAISLYQSQIHESLGNASEALAALKVHGQLLVRSLRHLPASDFAQPSTAEPKWRAN